MVAGCDAEQAGTEVDEEPARAPVPVDTPADENARGAGRDVGDAAREIGRGAKEVGKNVAEGTKELGKDVTDGTKEFGRGEEIVDPDGTGK